MRKVPFVILFLLCALFCGFIYKELILPDHVLRMLKASSTKSQRLEEITGPGIFFVETSDRLEPRPLVCCAVESAARINPNKQVFFLMKGLMNQTIHKRGFTNKCLSFLSAIDNVQLIPLDWKVLFQDTPLSRWYDKIDYTKERYWFHVAADASRLAVLWKYGGLYMDTDVISIRPNPEKNFLAAESNYISSNGVMGFTQHNPFLLDCMEDFVKNYRGEIWGNQGPLLVTRILKTRCTLTAFQTIADIKCQNISFLHPVRFYPIECAAWGKYYEVWKTIPSFNESYALHLWNYMNRAKIEVMSGSNTLAENLYLTYCPTTYKVMVQKVEGE